MRFPKDENETEKLILHAIEHGINDFDTAYIDYYFIHRIIGLAAWKRVMEGGVQGDKSI